MNPQRVTSALILGTILTWIAWDIWVAVRAPKKQATESEEIRSFGVRHPSFPYLVGGLMGHFFWNAPSSPAYYSTVVLPAISVPILLLDFANWLPKKIPSIVPFLTGLVLWHFLWPQPVL